MGQGYLNGTQSHYRFLPQQSTDFIFSILSEETKNESAPSSWEELFAGLCLEAEFEGGNVPDFWGLPALAGDGNKIVITCGQDKLLINGKEKR